MKKYNRILTMLLVLLLAALLTACGEPAAPAETDATAEPAETAAQVLENDGMTLTIPAEYAELVIAEAPENAEDGTLFTVSEKTSVEAAKKQGGEDWGAGWLFGVARRSEEQTQQMRTSDMSGAEIFAKDAAGNYYIFTHPTDVRILRDGEIGEEDMKQWSVLNEWAWSAVRDAFVAENEGLEPVTFGNSEMDIAFARIAYTDVKYTIGTTEYGPLEPKDVDPAPYLERLMNGVTYEYTDSATPDGEFVALRFPDEELRFDFFPGTNLIRRAYGEEGDGILYKATFADGETDACAVLQEWYDALKVNR